MLLKVSRDCFEVGVPKNNSLKKNEKKKKVFLSPKKALIVLVFPSGLVVPETRRNETIPEVMTTSGYAMLHFFSDAAYNLTGFNIFYSYVCTNPNTLLFF